MKRGELRRLNDSARRKISRNFGFRQSGYINWIVKEGYFFCLQHLDFASVHLNAKPMYADDLWWDIFNLSENKKCLNIIKRDDFKIISLSSSLAPQTGVEPVTP